MDRPSAALPTFLLRQRDAAFQRGLKAAELVEDLDRALKDGTLDTVDLFTDPGVRFGRAGGFCPAAEYRPGPSELLESADDGHDPDGSAPLSQCFPETAMRRAPGAERFGALVSRIDVQYDRQVDRE